MNKSDRSDLTDEQWEIIKTLIPPAKNGGRPRTVDMRGVINGIFDILVAGCAWCLLPLISWFYKLYLKRYLYTDSELTNDSRINYTNNTLLVAIPNDDKNESRKFLIVKNKAGLGNRIL